MESMAGTLLAGLRLTREGRKPSTMAARRTACERAAGEAEALVEGLRALGHQVAALDAHGLMGWNPMARARPDGCPVRRARMGMECGEFLSALDKGDVSPLLPAVMALREQSRHDRELHDFHDRLLNALDQDVARASLGADALVRLVWDGMVERAWDEKGEMTPSDYLFRLTGRLWTRVDWERMNWVMGGNTRRRLQAAIVYGEVMDLLTTPRLTSMVDAGRSVEAELSTIVKVRPAVLRTMVGGRSMDAVLLLPRKETASLDQVASMLLAWEVPEASWPRARTDWAALARVRWTKPSTHVQSVGDMLAPHHVHATRKGDLRGSNCTDALQFILNALVVPAGRRLSPARVSACISGERSSAGIEGRLERLHDRLPALNALRNRLLGQSVSWDPPCGTWRDAETGLEIGPISSSAELAEEGARMHHCVGGYDEVCMRGSSIIFGVRLLGDRVATLELVDRRPEAPVPLTVRREAALAAIRSRLSFGQLSEVANRRAQSTVASACRRFHAALLSGEHPVALGAPRVHPGERRPATREEIASALFPEVAKLAMPEWRTRTWSEWAQAMHRK